MSTHTSPGTQFILHISKDSAVRYRGRGVSVAMASPRGSRTSIKSIKLSGKTDFEAAPLLWMAYRPELSAISNLALCHLRLELGC